MKKRVLIADDDSSVREALRNLLEQTGYEVCEAVDGEDTLRKARSSPADLLLLDLEMPRRDGWDVLEELSLDVPTLPVIVITGRSDQLETRLIPCSRGLLEKPVEVDRLLERIQQVMDAQNEAGARVSSLIPAAAEFKGESRPS